MEKSYDTYKFLDVLNDIRQFIKETSGTSKWQLADKIQQVSQYIWQKITQISTFDQHLLTNTDQIIIQFINTIENLEQSMIIIAVGVQYDVIQNIANSIFVDFNYQRDPFVIPNLPVISEQNSAQTISQLAKKFQKYLTNKCIVNKNEYINISDQYRGFSLFPGDDKIFFIKIQDIIKGQFKATTISQQDLLSINPLNFYVNDYNEEEQINIKSELNKLKVFYQEISKLTIIYSKFTNQIIQNYQELAAKHINNQQPQLSYYTQMLQIYKCFHHHLINSAFIYNIPFEKLFNYYNPVWFDDVISQKLIYRTMLKKWKKETQDTFLSISQHIFQKLSQIISQKHYKMTLFLSQKRAMYLEEIKQRQQKSQTFSGATVQSPSTHEKKELTTQEILELQKKESSYFFQKVIEMDLLPECKVLPKEIMETYKSFQQDDITMRIKFTDYPYDHSYEAGLINETSIIMQNKHDQTYNREQRMTLLSQEEQKLFVDIIRIARELQSDELMTNIIEHSDCYYEDVVEQIYQTLFQEQKIEGDIIPNVLAKKVSYSVWSIFIMRYYQIIDNLFPPFQVMKWKKHIQNIFDQKSDRNFKTIYNEQYMTFKQPKTNLIKQQEFDHMRQCFTKGTQRYQIGNSALRKLLQYRGKTESDSVDIPVFQQYLGYLYLYHFETILIFETMSNFFDCYDFKRKEQDNEVYKKNFNIFDFMFGYLHKMKEFYQNIPVTQENQHSKEKIISSYQNKIEQVTQLVGNCQAFRKEVSTGVIEIDSDLMNNSVNQHFLNLSTSGY